MGFGLDIPFILTLPNLSLWIDFHGSYVRHDVVVSTSNLQLEDKASKNGTEKPSFREINTWKFKQIRLYFGYFPFLGQHFRNRASRYGTQETNVKILLRNALIGQRSRLRKLGLKTKNIHFLSSVLPNLNPTS